MMSNDNAHSELGEQTDGALRVARRHALKAHERGLKAHNRLDLDENGDRTRTGAFHNSSSVLAGSDQLVNEIEWELDRRDADYEPRGEILDL